MFDRPAIYKRFASCYSATYAELAGILGLSRHTAHNWKVGRYSIPWHRLKTAVDEHNLRWDWLIDGKGLKLRRCSKTEITRPLDRHGINQRFLSLFPADISQAKLGKELGVNGTTVFKWRKDMEQVSWERLQWAVETKGVTWEWLLEGRGKGPARNKNGAFRGLEP